ncbi:MAG TPA: hypothetical protein VF251_11615, partial [Pyrinomonadaceae bacterium]
MNYHQHSRVVNFDAPAFLCITAIMVLAIAASVDAQSATDQANAKPERPLYKLDLDIDFDQLSYTGVERLRWVNRNDKPTTALYFHLYPNLRVPDQQPSPTAAATATPAADEPRIDIVSVRSATSELSLSFGLEDQGTILRVNLREPVLPQSAADIEIKFKGTVPEIDPDETSLTTHVVKQVSAALRSERELRRARDINFRCRGIMLLATSYPMLVVRDGDEWRRKVEPSVGDMVFGEVADYEVTVTAPGVDIFTSAPEVARSDKKRSFSGTALREFAILVGKGFRAEHTEINGVKV